MIVLVTAAVLIAVVAPATRPVLKQDAVVDVYGDKKVADPFRWLETPDSPDTQAFVAQNNTAFRAFVDGPGREAFKARLTKLLDYPRRSAPTKRGAHYVFSRNDGLQNQSVIYVAKSVADTLGDAATLLIDPNKLSADGTISLSGMDWSLDGKLLAYGLSQSGSDQQTFRIRDIDAGKDLPDVLENMRFSSPSWVNDNSGFYYSRLPQPGSVPDAEMSRNAKLYFHKLGTKQSDDPVVYTPADADLSAEPVISEDGRHLFVYCSRGGQENRLYHREIAAPLDAPLTPLFEKEDASYGIVGNDGDTFYMQTNRDAARGKVVAFDRASPEKWKELIPQSDDNIDGVRMIADRFVVTYLHDAYHSVKIFKLDGSFERELKLPTVGSVGISFARRADREAFLTFTSFTYPSSSFRYDFDTDQLTPHFTPPVDFKPEDYEAKQIFATSKDGTKVPVFVVHKKGIVLDGTNPTNLYGYGGFSVNLGPGFSTTNIAWLERGGVYAMAILRGGSEYGEAWHRAGQLENKQHVFDDFIAAGELLCRENYTSPKHLSIEGGSNGGLLVAACVLQRPDLFGAVLCAVPVTDMLRYNKLGIGRYWVPEYGDSAKPEHFEFLIKYSPLHNVKPNVNYPPILITTAESDDRVVPAHSFKFAATLQTVSTSPNPVFLRVETKAGHGGGKPISKVIDEEADQFEFLNKTIGPFKPAK